MTSRGGIKNSIPFTSLPQGTGVAPQASRLHNLLNGTGAPLDGIAPALLLIDGTGLVVALLQ